MGPSDRKNPQSQPLNTLLSVGQNGVTTLAIMTPVFSIYAHVNKMQKFPENGQLLTATPQMDEYFSETYRVLEAMPQRYTKKDKDGNRKPIMKFNPRKFRYASFQQIVSVNNIKAEDLNQQQKDVLESPEMKAHLEKEQVMVSRVLSYYRWTKSKTKKGFEQWAHDEDEKKKKREAKK